ncbi:MAG: DUF1439 domain-containing protein [Verrucomicrobia bacterium]|nr:DUF1439 domain-containing protein [Verrucomicrobiota bacterium]
MYTKRILRYATLAILLVAGILAGRITRHGKPVTVRVPISQEMIDDALARKFPKEKVYLKIIRVTYSNPKATLLPESNRVRISLDTGAEIGVKGFSKTYQGSAAITAAVGYRPETHTFQLRDARVERLDLLKISQNHLAILSEGLNLVAEEWATEITVYQLTDRDTTQRLAKLVLRKIEIKEDKVIATLGL